MNVFDFDNTIYDGESSLDFFKFCIRYKPSLARHLPRTLKMAVKYKRGIVDKDEVMKFCGDMLCVLAQNVTNLDIMLEKFWEKNIGKLKPQIMNIIHDEDVIISASPSFIFDKIRDKFKGAAIISTEIDMNNMQIVRLCYGENKVSEFRKLYPGIKPDNFYTDNINDMPMMSLSKKTWLVQGEKITEFQDSI